MPVRFNSEGTNHEVLAIGNALTDFIVSESDAFLSRHALEKGTMRLASSEEAVTLYKDMKNPIEISGGSAANSMAGFAMLGGKCAFTGAIADDEVGRIFKREIEKSGVKFYPHIYKESDKMSGCCYITVTPDAQRTMLTYLGVAGELTDHQPEASVIQKSGVLYFEGYLWDLPQTKKSILRAADIAKKAGRPVAFTLSDVFCIERNREEMKEWAFKRADIIFANEAEIIALTETTCFDAALQKCRRETGAVFALTRSEKGAVIVTGDEVRMIDAAECEKVIDTTGAGDLFAAGFLYGVTHGKNLYQCGKLGALCAGEVISHYGARPERDLRVFLEQI